MATRDTSLLTTLLTALGAIAATAVLALSQAEPASQQPQDQQSLRVSIGSSAELATSLLPMHKG